MGHIDRQYLSIAAALVGGLLLLAACGDGSVDPAGSNEKSGRGNAAVGEALSADYIANRKAIGVRAKGLPALNMDPAVDYVGEQTCQSCHLGIHSTHNQTGMGRSFHRMRPEIVVADFKDKNELVVERTAVHYRMIERDGRYFQRQYLVDPLGREYAADEHELLYAVGSNNHNRGYILKVGDGFYQAPVCWYPQVDRWELCPGFERKNDHFGRELSDTCTFCHNGAMTLVEGTRNHWIEPIVEGIGCERCHGPGELHVQKWKKSPNVDRSEKDRTIVNPIDLPREERLSVCLQCHLGSARSTERVGRHDVALRSFRPGQHLTEVMMPFRYVEQTRYDFSISSQADRMMLSACYVESGGAMECLTCHNPHVTTYLEDRPKDLFNSKCGSCHATDDCAAPIADRQAAEDNCVSCHMRKAEPEDQRFTAFTDHWIRRTIDESTRDLRSSTKLEPIFPERLAALPKGEQAYYRARANFLLAAEATLSWRPRMYGEAEGQFREAIANGFDNDASRFFLGKTLVFLERREDAIREFSAALRHSPDHRDAAFALGQTLSEIGRPSESMATYTKLLTARPDDAMALAEYGRVAWSLRKFREALAAYERAVQLEPRNATYWMNLGMVLSTLGRFDEAALIGERAIALAPDNERIWYFYANVMREAGRPAEARLGQAQLERLTRPGS